MNRLSLWVRFSLLFSVCLLTACPYWGWDGKLEGTEIYRLDVVQDNTALVVTITIDTEKLNALQLPEDQKPKELFIWISPILKTPNPYEEAPSMYPAARTFIPEGAGSVTCRIDLAKIAYNNNCNLGVSDFDNNTEDNMTGCSLFAADNYEYNDNYITTTLDDTAFYFPTQRPKGVGYSQLRQFPDPAGTETWIPFILAAETLSISNYFLYANEPFYVTLQLGSDEMNTNLLIQEYNTNQTFYLSINNIHPVLSDPANFKYVWEVVINPLAPPPAERVRIDSSMQAYSTLNFSYRDKLYADVVFAGTRNVPKPNAEVSL